MSPIDVARASLDAYVRNDRAALEALLADDFRFTSPLDNALDRSAYLARCWPNSAQMQSATVVHAAQQGDRAFIVYEATTTRKRLRNCEMHTVRAGRLVAVEVYFGWDLPHPAATGSFVEPSP